jgi:hypothetical protein
MKRLVRKLNQDLAAGNPGSGGAWLDSLQGGVVLWSVWHLCGPHSFRGLQHSRVYSADLGGLCSLESLRSRQSGNALGGNSRCPDEGDESCRY